MDYVGEAKNWNDALQIVRSWESSLREYGDERLLCATAVRTMWTCVASSVCAVDRARRRAGVNGNNTFDSPASVPTNLMSSSNPVPPSVSPPQTENAPVQSSNNFKALTCLALATGDLIVAIASGAAHFRCNVFPEYAIPEALNYQELYDDEGHSRRIKSTNMKSNWIEEGKRTGHFFPNCTKQRPGDILQMLVVSSQLMHILAVRAM